MKKRCLVIDIEAHQAFFFLSRELPESYHAFCWAKAWQRLDGRLCGIKGIADSSILAILHAKDRVPNLTCMAEND
jgi:hypothetical protein